MSRLLIFTLAVACALGTRSAQANASIAERRVLALIIGVNKPAESGLAPLRFADDDAVRYAELFARLGAEAVLLAEVDTNTRRLHPEFADRANAPTGSALDRAVATLAARAEAARAEGAEVVLYVAYAGHGSRDQATGKGFLTLADGRLDAAAIGRRIVEPIVAAEYHFIVDACHAEFLAAERGAGGRRRRLAGFVSEVASRTRDARVGLIFATSPQTKTFEYEGFQSGVFSHLVRSGLYGAADFDVDGVVSYDEIQRFVALATAPVLNEKYRPRVHALRPAVTARLLDLRPGLDRSLVLDGTEAPGHRALEDRNGVRILDFHNGRGQTLRLVRPSAPGPLTLFSVSGQSEVEIPEQGERVALATLVERPRTMADRGAADNAMNSLFTVAFDRAALDGVRVDSPDFLSVMQAEADARDAELTSRRRWGTRALWLGAAAAAVGAASTVAALSHAGGVSPDSTQVDVAHENQMISRYRMGAAVSFGVAVTSALTGALLYSWSVDEDGEW
jgi:hypothetical protein